MKNLNYDGKRATYSHENQTSMLPTKKNLVKRLLTLAVIILQEVLCCQLYFSVMILFKATTM